MTKNATWKQLHKFTFHAEVFLKDSFYSILCRI